MSKSRKEVSLSKEVISTLQDAAKKDGRNLKNYMEKVLTDHARNKGLKA